MDLTSIMDTDKNGIQFNNAIASSSLLVVEHDNVDHEHRRYSGCVKIDWVK